MATLNESSVALFCFSMRLFIFFFGYAIMGFGQSKSPLFNLNFQAGLRLHDDTHELGAHGGGRQILSSPTFGLLLTHNRIPVSLAFQTDFWINPNVPFPDSVSIGDWAVHETWLENQLQLYFHLPKAFFGVGAYWKRRENFNHHDVPGFFIWKYSGIQLSAGLPLNWIDVEFRTKIGLTPVFAALGSGQHSLVLLYTVDKDRKHRSPFRKVTVNALMGARFFSTKGVSLIEGEDLTPVAIAPALGIEIIHRRSGISLNAERDWWVALNGGSPNRDLKGYINSSFLGIGYHKLLSNNRFIRFKIGGSLIIDYDKLLKITPATPNYNKILNYQVKGIGMMTSYELLPKTDIELKHTLPILGDRLFNPTRFSIGLIHRYNATADP